MHPPSLGETPARRGAVAAGELPGRDVRRVLRFVLLALASALLFVLLAPGCGRSSLEPEHLDGGSSSSTCGPATCPTGCCDANGVCRTGRDVRACGSAGGRCSDCIATGFAFCNAQRVCGRDEPACGPSTCSGCCAFEDGRLRCLSGTEAAACGSRGATCTDCAAQGRACDVLTRTCGSTSCSPANCDGCCVGDVCLPGDVATACGTGGAQCTTCATGQACRPQPGGGGICEGSTTCGPSNCPGCCNAAGQCVSGTDSTACGRGGVACAACGVDEVCVENGGARTCQAQTRCGPSNCPGCCVGNQCVVATTPQACGSGGEQCKSCPPGQVCGPRGQCVPATTECNPANCDGCCVGDICAVGTQNTACGAGGEVCQNCAGQNPPRVCQAGICQLPACGPDTCPSGCCIGNTCVAGTQDNACGPTGGGACEDCTATGRVCQGRQCREKCGPANCNGCCLPDNTCVTGIANNACGSGGIACTNCTALGSFCNGLVEPRRCNNQQNTCPAAYGSCPAGTATPVTPALQGVCSDAELDTLVAACAAGPDTSACTTAIAALATACRRCIAIFAHPFEQNTGLYACAASQVGDGCRRSMGCATHCSQSSCDQCSPTSENQCYALVTNPGGQCRAYHQAASCANAALSAGQLCSPFSYATFGQWLRGVGDHFCGNGP